MTDKFIVPPIVDCHAHIFTQDMPLSATAWNRPDYDFTAEDYLAILDEFGIAFGVIAGISLYGTYNDYMIEKLRQYKRLRGTVNISTDITRQELGAMNDSGVVGMRLFLSPSHFGDVPDIKNEDYQRLFRRVRDLDWHIHFLAAEDIFAESLDVLQEAGVKVVIDHFGRPDLDKGENCPKTIATRKAIDAGNAWLKISGGFRFAPVSDDLSEVDYEFARVQEKKLDEYWLKTVGAERLLWGSDAPFVGRESSMCYKKALDSFAHAVPDAADRHVISQTALKLYFS